MPGWGFDLNYPESPMTGEDLYQGASSWGDLWKGLQNSFRPVSAPGGPQGTPAWDVRQMGWGTGAGITPGMGMVNLGSAGSKFGMNWLANMGRDTPNPMPGGPGLGMAGAQPFSFRNILSKLGQFGSTASGGYSAPNSWRYTGQAIQKYHPGYQNRLSERLAQPTYEESQEWLRILERLLQ